MKSLTRREVILLLIIGLFILIAVAAASFYLGYQKNADTVKLMQHQQYTKDDQYGKSLDTLQKENATIATRNTVICAEYQKLYQAYDSLYTKTPNNSAEKYTIPGSASGNVDSCYTSN